MCLGETIKPVIICLCSRDVAIICPYLTAGTERAGSIYLHLITLYHSSFKGEICVMIETQIESGKRIAFPVAKVGVSRTEGLAEGVFES